MKVIPFEARFDTVLKRFYLMMAVALLGGFTGQVWIAVLALPIFLTAILGLKFELENKTAIQVNMTPATTTQTFATGPTVKAEKGRIAA